MKNTNQAKGKDTELQGPRQKSYMKPSITYDTPLYKKIILAVVCFTVAVSAVSAALVLAMNGVFGGAGAASGSFVLPGLDELAPDVKARLLSGLINPDKEVRGVWIASVSNINFPSKKGLSGAQLKAELDDIIATCVAANLNAIYFQVRPNSDALYKSSIFPTSEWLTGVQGSGLQDNFDPLEYLVAAAHEKGIAVHAWINPLRVTVGSASAPQHDVTKFASNNPARLHPEWTVAYADGKLYYNPGIPEVWKLVADGITEIVKNYDVDGVVFDDYFYPYPVAGAEFDDEKQFKEYGAGYGSIEDWRRDNINKLVKASYDAVKAVNANVQFGIAPGGIWQNDDGKNGGSATKGFETYKSLYADTLAWVKGGYVDYIAPQIYWQFSHTVAPFDVLVRWWNAFMIQYPDVKLLISHGAYRTAEWNSGTEIAEQVVYARSEAAYRGSIMYGYAAIKENTLGLRDALASIYSDEIIYANLSSDGSSVTVTSPKNGSTLNYENTYIIGKCDPGYPLYLDGKSVSFTKSGYFSVYVPLQPGENTFKFTQNGKDTLYTITRGGSTPAGTTYVTMDKFAVVPTAPTNDLSVGGGEKITVSAYAPSNSTVTATLAGQTVTLKPTIQPPDNSTYMRELYTGTITLPTAEKWTIKDLGSITFTAKRGGESATATGATVRVLGFDAVFMVEVICDDAELKISPSSWYYDDYTPQAAGMRDVAVRQEKGYYKLRCGGWIAEKDVKVTRGATVPLATLKSAQIIGSIKYTEFIFEVTQNVPMNGYYKDGAFYLEIFNTGADESAVPDLKEGRLLFSEVTKTFDKSKNKVTFKFKLQNPENFYGFEWEYSGKVAVRFRNPLRLAEGEKPLSGKTILLDAGHGGAEPGTTGPVPGKTEAYFNLKIVLAAKPLLEKLGANVVLTRSEDVTFKLSPDRLDFVNEVNPDLCVSVHQNALDYNRDITRVRGTVGLYWQQSGKLLTRCVSSAVAGAMGYFERTPTQQRLAMVRNPKFPSTLVEVSFLTCVEEVERLEYGGTDIAAQAIVDGILEFYRQQGKFIDEYGK
jgi:uncharacterized lipoprotein YddW (UPF0748 family)/N-acetylmuramoyl-L-alanine amidase